MRDGDRAGRIVFAYDCVAGTHDGRETQRRSSRPTSDATTGIGPYRMQDVRHADDQFGNIGWGGRSPSEIFTPYKALKILAHSRRLHTRLLQRVGTIDNLDFCNPATSITG